MIKIISSLFILCTTLGSLNVFAVENCQSCHAEETTDWQRSDHSKSMAIADSKSVLGDFNNTTATHFTQSALFYKDKNQFKIDLKEANKTEHYTVAYTFGFYPLQQYLIKTHSGKLQVFPFAWDARSKKEGGQKWYANNLEEDIKPNDRFHWLQPLQNWNGMCADCHSDGLTRHYSPQTKQFNTQYSNINVGCASCHADITDDHATEKKPEPLRVKPTNMSGWKREHNANIATWQGKPRDNSFMEGCYACHSLRSPLTDGFNPVTSYLDQFSPSLLMPNLYHVDGQIKEEVYVFGSFQQSKMYEAGVNCLDCHDKHTMKVKTIENGLCLQCHSPTAYQQVSHFKHEIGSQGAQCINCHMPTNRYMGVDDRRDHSFKIPRPDTSIRYGTPNACTQCHQEKTNEWAQKITQQWYGSPEPYSSSEQALLDLRSSQTLPLMQHIQLINDETISEIERASAISYLANAPHQLTDNIVKKWVESPLPLIRLAVANIGFLLPSQERLKSYASLLKDKRKSIRVAAAQNLAYLQNDAQPNLQSDALNNALLELATANRINAWRGEGNINKSMIDLQKSNIDAAITSLKNSIIVDPYFADSYINLADIYYQQGDMRQEENTLNQGLLAVPASASLHYAKGLSYIRAGDKKSSVGEFKTAMELAPNNVQFAYLYFLALDSIGLTQQALQELRIDIRRYRLSKTLVTLGLSFSQKLRNREAFQYFQQLQ